MSEPGKVILGSGYHTYERMCAHSHAHVWKINIEQQFSIPRACARTRARMHVQKIDIEWKFSISMQDVTVGEIHSWMQTPTYVTISTGHGHAL